MPLLHGAIRWPMTCVCAQQREGRSLYHLYSIKTKSLQSMSLHSNGQIASKKTLTMTLGAFGFEATEVISGLNTFLRNDIVSFWFCGYNGDIS